MMFRELYEKRQRYIEKHNEIPDLFFINTAENRRLWADLYASSQLFRDGATRSFHNNSLYIFDCLIIPFKSRALYGNRFAEKSDFKQFNNPNYESELMVLQRMGRNSIKFEKLKPTYHYPLYSPQPSDIVDLKVEFKVDMLEIPIVMILAYLSEMKRIDAAPK